MNTVHERAAELEWGHDYLMVEPNHFRVDYAINPFMHLDDQPDPLRARAAVAGDRRGDRGRRRHVEVLPQLPDAPDMVYAMNLGLALDGRRHPQVVLSHMRYAQRRMETPAADEWFAEHGFTRRTIGREGVGAHFEAGDAFAWRGELVVGYGPRTEELALKHLASDLGVSVRGFRITHPGMYHMDLGFCPLDETHAMVCPAAYDDASAAALLDLVPEPLVLTEEEALTFCANSIVLGRTDRDAGLPRPRARPARGVGLRRRGRRGRRVPQGRRRDPLPDQPPRRTPRPRPRPRRRGPRHPA